MVSKIFLVFLLGWLIPGSQKFVRKNILGKPILGFLYVLFLSLIPLISVLPDGTVGSYVFSLGFTGILLVCGLLGLVWQGDRPGRVRLLLSVPLVLIVWRAGMQPEIGIGFGTATASFNAILLINILFLLTDKKTAAGFDKSGSFIGITNFFTVTLLLISLHFLINELTGTFGRFSFTNSAQIDWGLFFYQISFYWVFIILAGKQFIFETLVALLGDFPRYVPIILSTVLIALLVFFSVENAGSHVFFILTAALLIAVFNGLEIPYTVTWLIVILIMLISYALFGFSIQPLL